MPTNHADSSQVVKPQCHVIMLINALEAGGSEKQLLMTAVGLQRRGYVCSIFWLDDRQISTQNKTLADRARESKVAFYAPIAGSRCDWRQLIKVRAKLLDSKHAVLWTWGYRADLLSLGIMLTTSRIAVIGSLRSAAPAKIQKYSSLWKILSRTHAAFISNSRLNVQLIAGIAPIIGIKSRVIYNAIEEGYFQSDGTVADRPQNLRVMMLGNQTAYIKGYDVAMRVAELIRSRGLSIKICIGGMPLDKADLVAKIQRQKMEDVIEICGNIADVPHFLGTGDVFMLLSRYEGTPNALLEAMALGLPAISTRVGDVAVFAEDGVHLRLIDGQEDAALDMIIALWDDWAATIAMAKAGRELCRTKFSEAAMIEATAKVIDEVQRTRSSCATRKWPTIPA